MQATTGPSYFLGQGKSFQGKKAFLYVFIHISRYTGPLYVPRDWGADTPVHRTIVHSPPSLILVLAPYQFFTQWVQTSDFVKIDSLRFFL
jgi:hypothetical protein